VDLLYINPGASGNSGFHRVKNGNTPKNRWEKLFDLEVWEKKRGI
jgi:hypothetical protein